MKYLNKALVTICLLVMTQVTITAQAYKLPEFKSFKLKNGLTIYLMEQHDVPVISFSAILPAVAIYDFYKAGLAYL
jgi:predicted Zn-dependent peptidase